MCECYDFAITEYQLSNCYSDAAGQSYLVNMTAVAAPYCTVSSSSILFLILVVVLHWSGGFNQQRCAGE